MCLCAREGEGDRQRDQQRLRGASESEMRPECDQRRHRADRQIPLSLDLMRRNSEPTEDREKNKPGSGRLSVRRLRHGPAAGADVHSVSLHSQPAEGERRGSEHQQEA